MSIREDIIELKETMTAYSMARTNCMESRVHFAIAISALIDNVNERLKCYLEALDNGELDEALGLDYKYLLKEENWRGLKRLKLDLVTPEPKVLKELRMKKQFFAQSEVTTWEIYDDIENGIQILIGMLTEIRDRIRHADMRIFGQFYLKQKSNKDGRMVTETYEEAKMQVGELTYEWLTRMQTQVVADFMKKGILRFAAVPTQGEIMKVKKDQARIDHVKESMPCCYEIPNDFEENCAKLRRYTYWHGDVFCINYNCLGKYLFQAFYSLSPKERDAVFELDFMLNLIHEDTQKLMPTESPMENAKSLSSARQVVLDQLLSLADKGQWVNNASAESIKAMLQQVSRKSEILWELLEKGRGDRVRIVWQNLIGFFVDMHLLPSSIGAPALNKMFFGDETGYTNIDKGRPSKNLMTADFESLLPILDAYVPKV